MTSSKELHIVAEATPFLDRMYPGWSVMEGIQEDAVFGEGYAAIKTDSCVLYLRRRRDGDEFSFAPLEHDNRDSALDLSYMLWKLGGQPTGYSLVSLLAWWEEHRMLGERWSEPERFATLTAIHQEATSLQIEFLNEYWWHGETPVTPPAGLLSLTIGAEPMRAFPGAISLVDRASPLLLKLFGPGVEPKVSVDSLDSSILISGASFDVKLKDSRAEEHAFVRPAAEQVEWLDINRITQTFVREPVDKTVESKLALIIRRLQSLTEACSKQHFEGFTTLIKAQEALDTRWRSVALIK